MPLDSVINQHIDKLETVTDILKEEVDILISTIDIDSLYDNPTAELTVITAELIRLIKEKYMDEAFELGVKLSDAIDRKEHIKVDPAKEPNKNTRLEGLLND